MQCDIFVVGTNPASTVSWASFWDKERATFNKEKWLHVYEEERAAKKRAQGKTGFHRWSTTRSRIEILNDALGAQHRALETNLYSVSTPKENDLTRADKIPLIFNFLLRSIKPKALLVHGDATAQYLRKTYKWSEAVGCSVMSFEYGSAAILFTPHLAARGGLVTNEKVKEWGRMLYLNLQEA
ncbi:hypothetical protein [Noviherbaspirillum denitrificans]|uniref:hypothetical protein n=1 Tax=Noviherbaspirillum denitrificans TaxID=1968433 RepID=UPI001130C73E|nr:hypothetical protein [Noviherbaspirillum denitrificans]